MAWSTGLPLSMVSMANAVLVIGSRTSSEILVKNWPRSGTGRSGVSSLAAGHLTLVPQLVQELKRQGAAHVAVVVGGIIPPRDYEKLRQAGAAAIFGPGSAIPETAREVLQVIRERRG